MSALFEEMLELFHESVVIDDAEFELAFEALVGEKERVS